MIVDRVVRALRKKRFAIGSSFEDRLFFAVATGWGYQGTAILCNLINLRLLFKYLDPELLGLWFLMVGGQALMGFFDFGFGQTLQRRIAYLRANCGAGPDVELTTEVRSQILELLAIARRVYVLSSMSIMVVMLVVGYLYFSTLDLRPDVASQVRVAWLVMSAGYSLNAWGVMVESALNGLGNIGWMNLLNLVAQIAAVLTNFVVLEFGGGIIVLAVVWLCRGALLRLCGWAIVRAKHSWVQVGGFPSSGSRIVRSMARPSLQWWSSLVAHFFILGVANYLIARFLGPAEVPDYAATISALVALQGSMVGIVASGTPLLSQWVAAGLLTEVARKILDLGRYALGILAGMFSFILVWGEEIFTAWLGSGHFVGRAILAILLVMLLVEAHQGILQVACVAAERLEFNKAILAGAVLNLILGILLIPRYGLIGAAIAALLAQLLTKSWYIPRLALKVLRLGLARDLSALVIPALMCGGLVGIWSATMKAVLPISIVAVAISLAGTISILTLFALPLIRGIARGLSAQHSGLQKLT